MEKQRVTIAAISLEEAVAKFKAQYGDVSFKFMGGTGTSDAKGISVHDFPNKGTRKWVTKYYVYQYTNAGNDVNRIYTNMVKVGDAEGKTDAVKLAKEHALANQVRTTVRLVKVLDGSDNLITDIDPKKKEGLYTFEFPADEE